MIKDIIIHKEDALLTVAKSMAVVGAVMETRSRRAYGTEISGVLQLSKSGRRAIGRVDRVPSHAATPNSLLMN